MEYICTSVAPWTPASSFSLFRCTVKVVEEEEEEEEENLP
jgi:hypothetical protein